MHSTRLTISLAGVALDAALSHAHNSACYELSESVNPNPKIQNPENTMNRTLTLAALALLSVSIPLQARAAPDIPPMPEPIIRAAGVQSLYDSGYDAMANDMASATASLEVFAVKYQAPPFLPGDTVNNGLKANAISSDSKTYLVIGGSIIGIGDGNDGPPGIIGAGADSHLLARIISSGILDDDPVAAGLVAGIKA